MKYAIIILSTLAFILVIINPFQIPSGWSAALTFVVGLFYFSYMKKNFGEFYRCELNRFKKILGTSKKKHYE